MKWGEIHLNLRNISNVLQAVTHQRSKFKFVYVCWKYFSSVGKCVEFSKFTR
jgi:hypothetical protein